MFVLHKRPAPQISLVQSDIFPIRRHEAGPDFEDSSDLNVPGPQSVKLNAV
jgi:hypothetical protein